MLKKLQDAGVDIIEIGMPFSDPLADGETIQKSSQAALENGMSIANLFEQLAGVREHIHIPLVLMGYLNPVLKYGIEQFCAQCEAIGIDGLILPDLPIEFYQDHYAALFKKHGLSYIGLITPQTPPERIQKIAKASAGFVYLVSSASTTGNIKEFGDEQAQFFSRINALKLEIPTMVGFGVKDKVSFERATQYANGAIIGSAFIKHCKENGSSEQVIKDFVKRIQV